jgi:hypothetical protein
MDLIARLGDLSSENIDRRGNDIFGLGQRKAFSESPSKCFDGWVQPQM